MSTVFQSIFRPLTGLAHAMVIHAAAVVLTASTVATAGNEPVSQEAIIRLEDGFAIKDVVATYNATLQATVTLGSRPNYLIGLPEGISEIQFLSLAEQDDRIKDAELNFTAAAPDPSTQSFFFPVASILRPSQAVRYGISLSTPTPTGGVGAGITVAVVDTGVDPQLAGFGSGGVLKGVSFVPNTDSAADVGDGQDSDGDGVTDELVGHGTFVASIIQLVAPDVTILPIRVLDADGKGNMFRVAQGIEAAILGGAHVVNISLGSTAAVDAVGDMIEEANLRGITVVASVGNDGSQLLVFPAATPGVISVAALDGTLSPAEFSNYGPHVTISALGVDLVGQTPSGENRSSGTSFSTALVSGTVAGMLSKDPTLLPNEIAARLASSAGPVNDPGGEFAGLFGAGALSIPGALGTVGATGPFQQGDLNLDATIDLADLNLVLGSFGESGPVGDADGSGLVDLADLNTLLGAFDPAP